MVKQSETIKIEIDGPQNQALYFRPIQRRIRGRFDVLRINEPNAAKLRRAWPEPIPGQRLELNLETGEAAIVEPLHFPEFAAIKEKIEATGQKIAPEREELQGVDVPTFCYFMREAATSGVARIVSGVFPETIGTPRRRFHSSVQPEPIDKLTAAIERQCDQQSEILKLLTKLVAK